MTKLIAVAGSSRAGKGTCARVFAEEAAKLGLTSFERQLSDNGKWSLARIFRPTIGRVEAVAWFENLKYDDSHVVMRGRKGGVIEVPLQKFLQHGLQEGGRDIFGADLWTDRIIAPRGDPDMPYWVYTFFDKESGVQPTDVALISDLRQPNEAERVLDVDGIVVEVVRPEVDDAYLTGVDHITERRLPRHLVSYQVVNDGTIEQLEERARKVFHVHLALLIKLDA